MPDGGDSGASPGEAFMPGDGSDWGLSGGLSGDGFYSGVGGVSDSPTGGDSNDFMSMSPMDTGGYEDGGVMSFGGAMAGGGSSAAGFGSYLHEDYSTGGLSSGTY